MQPARPAPTPSSSVSRSRQIKRPLHSRLLFMARKRSADRDPESLRRAPRTRRMFLSEPCYTLLPFVSIRVRGKGQGLVSVCVLSISPSHSFTTPCAWSQYGIPIRRTDSRDIPQIRDIEAPGYLYMECEMYVSCGRCQRTSSSYLRAAKLGHEHSGQSKKASTVPPPS